MPDHVGGDTDSESGHPGIGRGIPALSVIDAVREGMEL